MTSAPVSDDSIFLHESVIRGHHIFKWIYFLVNLVIVYHSRRVLNVGYSYSLVKQHYSNVAVFKFAMQ